VCGIRNSGVYKKLIGGQFSREYVVKANAINAEGKPNNDWVRARLRVGVAQGGVLVQNNHASQPGHKNNLLPIKMAAGCCISFKSPIYMAEACANRTHQRQDHYRTTGFEVQAAHQDRSASSSCALRI
jgi:hypothetical protein